MALDIDTLLNELVSHALASGYFDAVNTHEPDNSPGNGLTCHVILDRVNPINASGLDFTSVRAAFLFELIYPVTALPRDQSENEIVKAMDALMQLFTGDFTMGGNVRGVDALGAYGEGLSAVGGYTSYDQGGSWYRNIEITVPLIVDNVWEQVA